MEIVYKLLPQVTQNRALSVSTRDPHFPQKRTNGEGVLAGVTVGPTFVAMLGVTNGIFFVLSWVV